MRSIVVVLAAWLTASCATQPEPAAEQKAAAAPGEYSLYQITSSWTDQHGQTKQLSDLRGRAQVVALVYTNCGHACPRIVNVMKRIEQAMPDVGFVLVSIDPERDTPGRLAEFAHGSQLDPSRYTLLNGNEQDLMVLAAALDVRYRRVSETDFVHSNVMTVLDKAGNMVHQQIGFEDVEQTITVLAAMQEK